MILFIILIPLFRTAWTSGNVQLDITTSEDCQLEVYYYTNLTLSPTITQTVVFSFVPDRQFQVGYRLNGGPLLIHNYTLENVGQQPNKILQQDDVTVLIQAYYECNNGFDGPTCDEVRQQDSFAKTLTFQVPIFEITGVLVVTLCFFIFGGSVLFIMSATICRMWRNEEQEGEEADEEDLGSEAPSIEKRFAATSDNDMHPAPPPYTSLLI